MIFVNDQFLSDKEAFVSAKDRGFLLGDGVFTTLKYSDGQFWFFNEHFKRLVDSAQRFCFLLNDSCEALEAICHELIARNQLQAKTCAVRITLSRGVSERGLSLKPDLIPTLVVTAFPYEASHTFYRLQQAVERRHSTMLTSRYKTLNYLDAIMAKNTAIKAGFDDAIFLNENNHCIGTTTANIFLLKKTIIKTPSLDCGALAGVMRGQVISQCRNSGYEVHESSITWQELLNADAVFLTSSLIDMQSVERIESQTFKPFPELLTIRDRVYYNRQ